MTLEWLATDPKHSFIVCRGTCHPYTYATTRLLRLAYFDGASADKMASGPMDPQDIVARGKVSPDKFRDEDARIKKLCEWGERFELDGFVR